MEEVITVNCPYCHKDFSMDFYTGEAHQHPQAILHQVRSQQIGWAELRDEIRRGYGGAILSVGDEIEFNLRDGTPTSVVVLDIAPNSVVFGFVDAIDTRRMNPTSINHGGWGASEMADYLDSKIDALPYELADAISVREIRQTLDGVAYVRKSKLWLPSITEVFKECEDRTDCELSGRQFEYFKSKRHRVKRSPDDDDCRISWWLRSPYVSSSQLSGFWFVNFGGGLYIGGASVQCGVAPCFSI